jgi:hypothetical protein
MLTRTSLALVGAAGVVSMLAGCSASEATDKGAANGSGASTSSGGSGGTLNLGGNGAGSNVGGLGASGPGGAPLVACDAATPCAEGNVCASGFCAPNLGPCASDSDCDGDSYCCGDGCRDDGGVAVCIPYGYGPRGTLNPECKGAGEPGVFAPSVQCEWLGPAATDPYPDSKKVLTSPLSANLPNDSGAAAEIVILTYAGNDGSAEAPGVIRILNGQTCELLESIYDESDVIRANATPALADLDNDGTIEIVTRREGGGVVAFAWNGAQYAKRWAASTPALPNSAQKWDGPSIHDLDDDGLPEVIVQSVVYDGQSGAVIDDDSFTQSDVFNGMIPVLGDFDADGQVELVAPRWNELSFFGWSGQNWVDEGIGEGQAFNLMASHYAVADFGTPGATAADFDPTLLDGIAEIVAVQDLPGRLTIHTLERQLIFDVATGRGGPPTIADFDADGLPEVALAGATEFSIYDFDCVGGGPGCAADGVRWSQPSQDASSAQTGVAVFDFDGDGQAEAVYADECFLRVYDGLSGEVLYSAYRTSGTWYESPLVADVDNDQNTEIVVNNNVGAICPVGGALDTPYVDPLHRGVRCDDDDGCVPGGACSAGFCRCSGDADCDVGMTCVAPSEGTPGSGQVCRATHPNSAAAAGGVRVLRDRLDRWASSRTIWNQHAYSITNVNDDGTVPRTSEWLTNWTQGGLNNYRQNVQGSAGFDDYPDITGALSEDDVCIVSSGGDVTLTATVCNRGAKAVGADMPATFYRGEPAAGEVLCVSFTPGPVPVEGCLLVSCTIDGAVTGEITMVVNDDGGGGQTTVECNSDNNQDTVTIESCVVK